MIDRVKATLNLGQSIWLDYIDRRLLTGGELKRLVDIGVRGLTSNPTIFEKAVSDSTDYDGAMHDAVRASPHANASAICEKLMTEDIKMAADILRPVYDASEGADGFVSLEVSPRLARDAAGTIAEAKRLWREVDRPNLMIKVPGTREGVPAIEALIAEGINVNATLLFSAAHSEAVASAYIRGLERHPQPRRVASVASFFVSRVDTVVDKALERVGTPKALALRGKTAIANTKSVYARFQETFHGDSFARLRQRGARVQRPVWGSTSTKNPTYSDVLYIEGLIGPDTVNTMPPETLKAYLAHGAVQPSLLQGLDDARQCLAEAGHLGIDLAAVTEQLQVDGVAAFAASFDKLLAAIDGKRQRLGSER